MFTTRYGADRWAEFRADPWTNTFTEEHFEQLLSDVHAELRDKHFKYTHLLEPFAGPQCHEDRGAAVRMRYNVKFRASAGGQRQGRNRAPLAQAPPQRTLEVAAGETADPATSETPEAAAVETPEAQAFYLRKCVECGTLRVLDSAAAAKYPLGRYTYADRQQRVRFTCDRLVGITCDTAPDIEPCTAQNRPSTWLALGPQSADDHLPTVVVKLRRLRLLDACDNTEETQVVGVYHYRGDSRAAGLTGRHSLVTRTTNSGVVTLGTMSGRRRFQAIATGCRFTAAYSTLQGEALRQAKCCQPWHDPSDSDHEDPSAALSVTNLQVLRDIHSVYDALRRVRCIICGQQTPGLPYPDDPVLVPEHGRPTELSPNSIVSGALIESTLLRSHSTVTLDPKFRDADDTVRTDRDATGVCTMCSPAYDVDANGKIVPRPLVPDIGPVEADPNDIDDFVDAEPPVAVQPDVCEDRGAAPPDDDVHEPAPTHIAMYSVQNLVSTDMFSDDAYRRFVETLTRAELMVLRPIHLFISIMRLRANKVPFSKHGSICYPLKERMTTSHLPWYDFATLPFVVVVQHNTNETSQEAMVNMKSILLAREYMERSMPCPYTPGVRRPFYRFVGQQWMPFSNDHLQRLQACLVHTDQYCLPNGLRVLVTDSVQARAGKPLRFGEFRNWLESGFQFAETLWDSYRATFGGEGADTTEATDVALWQVFEDYVVGRAVEVAGQRHRGQTDDQADTDDDSDGGEVDVTMSDVVECAVERRWLLATTTNDDDRVDAGDQRPVSTLMRCCEELELLSREYGNDDGSASGVGVGATVRPETERPEEIRARGIARTALHHVPMPGVDREHPLPESAPGYMQMAFPDVFRTGDADPYQDRKVSIRQPSTSWIQNYFHWMSRQPEAEGNVEFQFVVSNQLSRDITGQEARIAIKEFGEDLPTKEQLLNDPAKRDKVAKALLCLQSKMEDSDAYWRILKQEMIGIIRYLEDPPAWRPDMVPMEVFLWQTRAVPYNHHPAIHRLCNNAEESERSSDEQYLTARLANTLRHPGIVSWVAAFIGEMDTLALARARYDASYYMVRSEWGANANPHVHRHVISESFSRFLGELKNRLELEKRRVESEIRADDATLESDVSRSAIETRLKAAWRDCQQQYIARIERCYTNWNAGFTKDGERTYDFAYDRKTTVCRARMATMLDDAMTTGSFVALDDLYVRVINGTLRHTGHSGRGDAPSAKDGCAVRRLVIDKAATEAARALGRKRPVKKQVIVCKRRMPRGPRPKSAVVPDAHDPRITQCETACNDPFMGGHDPFAVLHIMNNIDDKAIVPGWLAREPRIKWQHDDDDGGYHFDLVLARASGDSSVEYALKYGFKPVAPVRTPGDVLLTALERRQDGDSVDLGVVKRMYNRVAASLCQSIFQAVHKNWQLPLLLRNVKARGFSLSGTRMLKPSTADADNRYAFADTLERFDMRLADNVRASANVILSHAQDVMSVFQFFDEYTITEKTIDGEAVPHIGKRKPQHRGVLTVPRLQPHLGRARADPNRPEFWKYARDIVRFHQPCKRVSDLMPPRDCVTDDSVSAHWRSKYEALLASDVGVRRVVPEWVHRYHVAYHEPPADSGDDTSDDESDGIDDEPAVDDVAAAAEDDGDRELNATRVRDPFYQTTMDAMTACHPDDVDDATQRFDGAAASVANPAGYDFQARWLGDRVVNPDHVRQNYARLTTLRAGDAAHASSVAPSGRQRVLPCIVKRYLVAQREWARSRREWNGYDEAMTEWRQSRSSRCAEPVPPTVADIRDRPPKALRAFLLGDPGAGKSTTLRSTVHDLTELLAEDAAEWADVIKLSAPTGCASFHMAHGATTMHRLFGIAVDQQGDAPLDKNGDRFAKLCERLRPELGLLIFDEFSMIMRKMIRWVVCRLQEARVNLDHIGVLFVGDPAQILPIGDSPVWSLREKTDDGRDCCQDSLLGRVEFRELFRMPAVETVECFDAWRGTVGKPRHELTDREREQVARFRAAAFDGDYQTVYLNEVHRVVQDDQNAAHFTNVIIPSFRYGRASATNLQWLRDNTATVDRMSDDPLWGSAVTLHGNHWFSEWAEHRATVESDNARALVRFASEHDTPVMAVEAQHIPAGKAAKLKKVSPKEFRSVQAVFYACSGLPLMLLENVAPSVGLFNGAHVQFVGPLYLDDDWQVTLTRAEFDAKVVTDGVTLTDPIDTPASGRDRMYQIPAGSVIVRVNGETIGGNERRLRELVDASTTVQLTFHTPKRPPHLPEFLVVRVPFYTHHGGPNVLGIEDADDLVPIRVAKRGREKDKRRKAAAHEDDRHTEFRVGPPLEGGSAFTGFKGQGATLQRVVAKVKAWVETPGFWTVVVSRVKHPHHLHIPDDQWPTFDELQMQRLNEDVLEAEIFERQMKINAAKTWRHFVADDADGDWSREDNVIADAVHLSWRTHHRLDVVCDVCDALRTQNDVDVTPADVQRVLHRMSKTDEALILEKPIYLTMLQHKGLLYRKVQHKRRRTTRVTAPKRRATTSADRGRRTKRKRL